MRHPKLVEWERKLTTLLHDVDYELEGMYGGKHPLHPARPAHGTTSSRSQDGLFGLTASFSPGFGSNLGRGYIVNIRIATLDAIPEDFVEEIEDAAMRLIREKLPLSFPDQDLQIDRDGHVFKITGDFSLGTV